MIRNIKGKQTEKYNIFQKRKPDAALHHLFDLLLSVFIFHVVTVYIAVIRKKIISIKEWFRKTVFSFLCSLYNQKLIYNRQIFNSYHTLSFRFYTYISYLTIFVKFLAFYSTVDGSYPWVNNWTYYPFKSSFSYNIPISPLIKKTNKITFKL